MNEFIVNFQGKEYIILGDSMSLDHTGKIYNIYVGFRTVAVIPEGALIIQKECIKK